MGTALEAMLNRMASMVEASTNAACIAAAAVQSMQQAQNAGSARSGLEGGKSSLSLKHSSATKQRMSTAVGMTFREYLVAVDANFDGEISALERSLNTPVLITSAEQQARASSCTLS